MTHETQSESESERVTLLFQQNVFLSDDAQNFTDEQDELFSVSHEHSERW